MSWTRVVIRDEIGDFANNLSEIIGVQTEVLLGPSMAPPKFLSHTYHASIELIHMEIPCSTSRSSTWYFKT